MKTSKRLTADFTPCRQLSKIFEQELLKSPEHHSVQTNDASKRKNELLILLSDTGKEIWKELQSWQHAHGGDTTLCLRSLPLKPYDPEALYAELCTQWRYNLTFTWSLLRSHTDYLVKQILLSSESTHALDKAYQEQSSYHCRYWFRKNPQEHLSTGFHTALSCFFKLYTAAFSLWLAARQYPENDSLYQKAKEALESPERFLEASRAITSLSKVLASGHLFLLNASDSLLWDSAGATAPYHILLADDGSFHIASDELKTVLVNYRHELSNCTLPESRTGCPALYRDKNSHGTKLFEEVELFCQKLFLRYIYPLRELELPECPFYQKVEEGLILIRDETHKHPAPLRSKE